MNRRPGRAAAPFLERTSLAGSRPEVNPYRDRHASFGQEILPAEVAPGAKGRWNEVFGREAPRFLELGLGNGSWLADRAASAPAEDWIGLEIRFKRCVQAAEKLRAAGATNGRVVRYSWFDLPDLFADGELCGIYVHHPDPWVSSSEAKHRLIKDDFVALAARLVRPGGELRLKTDFRPHQQALLAGAERVGGWTVHGVSDDVRTQGAPWPDDVITGYQAKFDAQGLPVYAVWLKRL